MLLLLSSTPYGNNNFTAATVAAAAAAAPGIGGSNVLHSEIADMQGIVQAKYKRWVQHFNGTPGQSRAMPMGLHVYGFLYNMTYRPLCGQRDTRSSANILKLRTVCASALFRLQHHVLLSCRICIFTLVTKHTLLYQT
jgi:hypothetical protein